MIQRLRELGEVTPPAFWLVVLACAYLTAVAVLLTVIDVRHHRLPDRIVLPSYAVAGVLLLGAAVIRSAAAAPAGAPGGNADLLSVPGLRVVAGGAALWLFYLLLRALYPPGMGFGDVKLAGVLGMYLGFLSWAHVLAGTFAAFLLGGLWSLGLLLSRRGTLKSSIPFGPFMLAGTALAMVLPA